MDLRFQRPSRQSTIMAMPRAVAVRQITHQIPSMPHRNAAHAANGIRRAVSVVDASIGGKV